MAKYNIYLKGFVGEWDFSSDMVQAVLDKNAGKPVSMLISSLGGYASDAMLISALIRQHGAVNVHYIGMNASAATIASMGAAHISMDADALYLVHKSLVGVFDVDICNADAIALKIEELNKLKRQAEALDLTIASMYARRCRKSSQDLIDLMSQERWLTAKEALEWGFIDEITDAAEDKTERPTSAAVAAMCEAGLPVPPGSRQRNVFARFLDWIESSFTEPEAQADTEVQPEPQQPVGTVVEGCDAVAAVLECDGITAVDSSVTMQVCQLQALNNELSRLQAINTEQAERIDALLQQPAEPKTTVTDDCGITDNDIVNVNARASELFNAIK